MTEARIGHTATLLPNGKVLVVGGFSRSGGGALASAELYDPISASWSATGGMIGVRYDPTATLLPDGKVLVAGGAGITGGALASAELYDPSSGSWSATGGMIDARGGHTATLLPDGRVLVTGGYISDVYLVDTLASAELYDPSSGSWTAAGNLDTPRNDHTATLLADGKVLVVGGFSLGGILDTLASAELYDPSSGSWTAAGNLDTPRNDHTATLLADGKVLVAGGQGIAGLFSAELYDPSSGCWTATGRTIVARGGHTATLLPDGRVLVVGGQGIAGIFLASAALYDPGSGSWTATENLNGVRSGHTATLVPDVKVLVAGGSDGPDELASAELYDLSGGTR